MVLNLWLCRSPCSALTEPQPANVPTGQGGGRIKRSGEESFKVYSNFFFSFTFQTRRETNLTAATKPTVPYSTFFFNPCHHVLCFGFQGHFWCALVGYQTSLDHMGHMSQTWKCLSSVYHLSISVAPEDWLYFPSVSNFTVFVCAILFLEKKYILLCSIANKAAGPPVSCHYRILNWAPLAPKWKHLTPQV